MKYVIDINSEVLEELVIEINNGLMIDDKFVYSIFIESKTNKFKDYFKIYPKNIIFNIPQAIIDGLDHISKESHVNTDDVKRKFLN